MAPGIVSAMQHSVFVRKKERKERVGSKRSRDPPSPAVGVCACVCALGFGPHCHPHQHGSSSARRRFSLLSLSELPWQHTLSSPPREARYLHPLSPQLAPLLPLISHSSPALPLYRSGHQSGGRRPQGQARGAEPHGMCSSHLHSSFVCQCTLQGVMGGEREQDGRREVLSYRWARPRGVAQARAPPGSPWSISWKHIGQALQQHPLQRRNGKESRPAQSVE